MTCGEEKSFQQWKEKLFRFVGTIQKRIPFNERIIYEWQFTYRLFQLAVIIFWLSSYLPIKRYEYSKNCTRQKIYYVLSLFMRHFTQKIVSSISFCDNKSCGYLIIFFSSWYMIYTYVLIHIYIDFCFLNLFPKENTDPRVFRFCCNKIGS